MVNIKYSDPLIRVSVPVKEEILHIDHYHWENLDNDTEGTKCKMQYYYEREGKPPIRKKMLGVPDDPEIIRAIAAGLNEMADKLENGE